MRQRSKLKIRMMHAAKYLAGTKTLEGYASDNGIGLSTLGKWVKNYKTQNPHWREHAHEVKCRGASDEPDPAQPTTEVALEGLRLMLAYEADEGAKREAREKLLSELQPMTPEEPPMERQIVKDIVKREATVEFSDGWRFMHSAGWLREAHKYETIAGYVEKNGLAKLGVTTNQFIGWVDEYKRRNPYWRMDLDRPLQKQSLEEEIIDRFAVDMKAKMLKKKSEGWSGWDDPEQISNQELSEKLLQHVYKGDPVDVANFCMMLAYRGARIDIPATEKPITHVTLEMLPLKVRSLPGMPAKFAQIPQGMSIPNFLIDLGASLEQLQQQWESRAELDQMTLQQYAEDEIAMYKKIDALKETLKIFVKDMTND